MDRTGQDYEQLIEKIATWACAEEDIRAAFIIGSRARVDHPADEWSDLDVAIIARNPATYLESADWVAHISPPWLTFIEPTGDGRSGERRVLYEGGLDVDFAFIVVSLAQQMVVEGVPADVVDTLQRGTRVLLDKDGLAAQLLASATAPRLPQPLAQATFLEIVNDFWYHAVWTAKHLRRRELWWAKSCSDGRMKELLRYMMEWHTRATKGQTYDTWLRGRFLEEWADPRALESLSGAFAHYEEEDVWRALFVTMDLFRWLAIETAEKLEYEYPVYGDERATALVHHIYAEKP